MRSTERRGVPQWLGAMQLRRGRVRVHGAVHGAVWSSPNVTCDIGVSTSMYTSHDLDEQGFKKTIEHKTVVFLGHMNDNSNFTFTITST